MQTEQAGATVRDRIAQAPGMGELVGWADRTGVDIDAEVRNLVQSYFGDPVAIATGSITAIFQAIVAIFILFYLLRDRKQFVAAVYRLLPMREAEADRVVGDAAGSVFANLYAAFVTALIDGVTLGLMFWALGLPSPVTWGLVAFIVSFLPILGVYIVWVPAAVYLAMVGDWVGVVALTAWGVGVGVILTTYVYTRLAGNRMRLHPVPTLLAFLGGLSFFGASGLILGPATLAVTVAVLEVWHYRAKGEEMPASAAAEEKPAPAGMSIAPTPGVAH
jgi:predicted PurR-regulated permease PerM